MTTKKITKKEMFNQILAKLTDETEKAFIEHEIELLDKKNSRDRKPTAKQLENEEIKVQIVELMTQKNKRMTVGEILKALGNEELSSQKVSALVRQLKENGTLKREEEKGKAYFTVA